MKKLFLWGWNNILFLSTLFLLMFIPLYPKLPLLNVRNTWVYIRAEDFLVVFVLVLWLFLFLEKSNHQNTSYIGYYDLLASWCFSHYPWSSFDFSANL